MNNAIPVPKRFNGLPLRWAWPYRNAKGDTTGIVGRYQSTPEIKECVPFFRKNGSSWQAGGLPDPRPLFGLEYLAATTDRRAVIVPEGEKCAAALQSLGLPAVTSQGGSKAAAQTDWGPLSGFAQAFLLADNDTPGREYVRDVFTCLSALDTPPACQVVTLPGLPAAGDVVNWLQSHCPDWDGFSPIPESERDRLLTLFRQAIKTHAAPVPEVWAAPPQGDWEPPIPLDEGALPPWPTAAFPEPVEGFVHGLALSTETPVEVAALISLAGLATAAQGKYVVMVKPGYLEPVNVWVAPALVPGTRKTAVITAVTAPIVRWEQAKRKAMEADARAAESEHRLITDRVTALRKKASTAKPIEAECLKKDILELEASLPDIPRLPQIWADDVTPERLGAVMADNDERLAILSDEAGVFENMAGRYSGGIPNLDVYLQSHAGSPVRVDRGSRPPVFMRHPVLTMGITPQPDVLRGLTTKPGFRGRGLLGRFLYALPRSPLGQRTGTTPPLPDAMRHAWAALITALLEIPIPKDAEGEPAPHLLKLTADAYSAWFEFWQAIEADMGPAGRFECCTDWAGKLPGAVARLAALLHIARHAHATPQDYAISDTDMNAAIRIGHTLAAHALAVFDMMGADPAIDGARRVLAWIKAGSRHTFSFRDCHHDHKHHFKQANELEPVLRVLEERLYLRPLPTEPGPKGGRPSRRYEVNPAALTG